MAIKISGLSIIDDSRNIINANSVGIGTTIAQATLDIYGSLGAGGTTGTAGQVLKSTGTGIEWGTGGGGGSLNDWVKKVSADDGYTAVNGDRIIADTTTAGSASFTINLPATPTEGNSVVIADGGDWSTNNLTIGRNGSSIEGVADDLTLDIAGISLELVYDSDSDGWQVYTGGGPSPGITGIDVLDNDTPVGSATSINFGTGLSVSAVSAGLVTVTNTLVGAGEWLPDADGNLFAGTFSAKDFYDSATGTACNNVVAGSCAGSCLSDGDDNIFFGRGSGNQTTNGDFNIFFGVYAGNANTTGNFNFFGGYQAGQNADLSSFNNAIGYNAGRSINGGCYNDIYGSYAGKCLTSGSFNFIGGYQSGGRTTTGSSNIFLGHNAGFCNTTQSGSIAIGSSAGRANAGDDNIYLGREAGWSATRGATTVTGTNNFFAGVGAGGSTTSGNYNTFFGAYSGYYNTTGSYNNFIGYQAGNSNLNGSYNNFFGRDAGVNNISGRYNNFFGRGAGGNNTGGSCNNFFGNYAGYNNEGCYNNFFGLCAGLVNTTGNDNTFLGRCAGYCNSTQSGSVAIGSSAGRANAGDDNIYLGREAGWSAGRGATTVTGTNNFFAGVGAGSSNTSGCHNNFFGASAGSCNQTGSYNNFFGRCAGYYNTGGYDNNFLGKCAGRSNTGGNYNNFFGRCAGYCNDIGNRNNFFGDNAGRCNTSGNNNNFFGLNAGFSNITGDCNTMIGVGAGRCATVTGSHNNFFGTYAGKCASGAGAANNFIGCSAGYNNTTGGFNNFFGDSAGYCNTSGSYNNFLGKCAGRSNTGGNYNNFFGRCAGYSNTTGSYNNFIGHYTGRDVTLGNCNNFFGTYAGLLIEGCHNSAFGHSAGRCTVGDWNTFIGSCSGKFHISGDNNVAIGQNVDVPNTTGSTQLAIGSGSSHWITGDSSFNIGIGTKAPDEKLDVNGNVKIRGELRGPELFIIDPAVVGDNTGAVRIKGDLYVDGENFIVDSQTITLADFVVGIASTVPNDTLLDGAGIGIGSLSPGGQHYHTFLYEYNGGTNPSLKSSENLNVATGKVYQIAETERLSADTLSLGTGTTIHSPASNTLTFGTNDEERVRIDSSGAVGIGTDNPTQTLDVNGNVAIGGSVYDNNNLPGTNGQVLSNVTGFGVSWTDAPTGQVNVNEISSGSYYIGAFEGTGSTGQAYIETTNPVVLTSEGNVGIGSTIPQGNLDINVGSATTINFGYNQLTSNDSVGSFILGRNNTASGGSSPKSVIGHNNTISVIGSPTLTIGSGNIVTVGGNVAFLGNYNTGSYGIRSVVLGSEHSGTYGNNNVIIGKSLVPPVSGGDNQLVIGVGINTTWIVGDENGNIGIGTTTPSGAADPNNTKILNAGIVTANFYYGDGSNLTNLPAAGGASDGTDFNTGITTTKYASASDDIDGFTAIAVTFPSTAGRKYLVESIHVTNITAGDLYITSRIDYDGGEDVPFTNKVLIPEQGAIDIVDESFVCNPSDNIRLAAYNGIGATAAGILNGLDCFVTYTEKEDTNYIGIGSTTKSTFTDETVFTSNTNPSVINTITLTNNSDVADLDASVSMFRGGTIRQGYFVYNLTIPQNSSVQILPKAKRLNPTDTIVVRSSSTSLGINVAGKYIT